MLVNGLLVQHWLGFTMSDVSRRRADQFRNLVAVLKFAAVDLDESMRISEQGFGRGLDKMRFARACRAKKQQASQWPSRCGQTGPASLEDVDDRPDCPVLADDFRM